MRFRKSFLEEMTSKLRLEGGARLWKTWGRIFQAKGLAKAKAQVCTSPRARGTD